MVSRQTECLQVAHSTPRKGPIFDTIPNRKVSEVSTLAKPIQSKMRSYAWKFRCWGRTTAQLHLQERISKGRCAPRAEGQNASPPAFAGWERTVTAAAEASPYPFPGTTKAAAAGLSNKRTRQRGSSVNAEEAPGTQQSAELNARRERGPARPPSGQPLRM